MNSLNRSRPDRRPRAGSELLEREVEKTWYRTPRLTLPIPGVREFQLRFDIAEVGIELDHKLAVLLDALAVPVLPELKE
jgi:hypothetical protein